MPISRIAFLDIMEFDSGEAFRGAVLLTEEQTVPLEFYLTDPLRPNPLQRLLYGAIFEEYLKFEVFGKPLLSNLSTRPDIVLVRESTLLHLVDVGLGVRRVGAGEAHPQEEGASAEQGCNTVPASRHEGRTPWFSRTPTG